ncbi:MAG: hypothetical protein WC692_09740 [Erythrobacter sp.]
MTTSTASTALSGAPGLRGRITALRRETGRTLGDLFANRAWRRIAFFLLPYAGTIAGMDVAAHYGSVTGALLPAQLYISQDGGFGEYLEYSLTAAMAGMLFVLWLRTRAMPYLGNALLFVYLTVDNSLQFHERFGHWIAPAMPQDLPLRANDCGEILLFAIIGAAWLVSLTVALLRSQLRPAAHALILAAGIVGAAFFGVAADAATSWGKKTACRIAFEAWLEDGGEFAMLIATFLACCALFDIERRARAFAKIG